MSTSNARRQLTLIDQSVADHQALIEGLPEDMPYVLIESGRDGIAQLGAALAGRQDLSAIHVISHGAPGKLLLGNTWLDVGALQAQAPSLRLIGESLAPAGDLLLYGCKVAEGESGMAFLRQLAEITGAEVAASTDLTGPGGMPGLEAHIGPIDATEIDLGGLSQDLDANSAPRLGISAGQVTTDFDARDDSSLSVTLQADGKILVAGYGWDGSNNDFALARYNPDGSLDTGFSGDGRLTTSFGAHNDDGMSVTVQADGKILVAGVSENGSGYNFALARYHPDGSLDTSFSGDGLLTTDFGANNDKGSSVILQADGKILVAGTSNADFALARYHADGSLDTDFADDGLVTTDFGSNYDFGTSIALQADGKILVAGDSDNNGNVDFALARYHADGTLDTGFSDDGLVTTDFGSNEDLGFSVTVQANGKILVAGTSNDHFALARYNADGSLDTSLSGDGLLTTDFGSGNDSGSIVIVQADSKILVAGSSYNGSGHDFALARYNTDGTLDTGFSGDGLVTTDFGSDFDFGTSVTLLADGRILVAGESHNGSDGDFALARYNPDGSIDTRFGTPTYTEGGNPVRLDSDIRVLDAELAALDDDAGNYAGASLTLARHGGANDEDSFNFDTSEALFTVSAGNLQAGGLTFATFTAGNGSLGINFASTATPATQALVDDVLRHITYSHSGDAPPDYVQIDWNFSDGHATTPLTATGSSTVTLTGINDTPTGTVSITGTAMAGATLTAGNNLADADGLGSLTWQWQAAGVDIPGATGDSLVLGQDQLGKTITVIARYTDAQGTVESVSSAATAAVASNGNQGNDTLQAGNPTETLAGGAGDDLYIVLAGSNLVTELAGEGMDTIQSPYSRTLGAHLENLVLTGNGPRAGTGNHLDNVITGNAGNNLLDGGVGSDTLAGGLGDDSYVVDNPGDVIQESTGAGNDTVISSLPWTLGDHLENLVLTGTRHLHGSGNDLDNHLTGNGGGNVLNGGNGADVLDGGSGNDTLTGGAGSDTFAFTTPLHGSRNVDTITDFTSEVDKIELSSAIFTQLDFLNEPTTDAFFQLGTTAQDTNDRILYDQAVGSLYYDADGTGAIAAIRFAVLSSLPTLHYTDFIVA